MQERISTTRKIDKKKPSVNTNRKVKFFCPKQCDTKSFTYFPTFTLIDHGVCDNDPNSDKNGENCDKYLLKNTDKRYSFNC